MNLKLRNLSLSACFGAFLLSILQPASAATAAGTYDAQSPDGSVQLTVSVTDDIRYSVRMDGKLVVAPSPVSMTLADGAVLGDKPKVKGTSRKDIRQELKPVVPEKFAVIHDTCTELTIAFEGAYSLTFRVYHTGVAYRWHTGLGKQVTIKAEQADVHFEGPTQVFFPEETSFFSHNERLYVKGQLDSLDAGKLASLPALFATPTAKVLIAESGLRDYPGMWIKTSGSNALTGVFPPFPLVSKLKQGSDRDVPVTESADYIARTEGTRDFPWRVLALARQDADLLTNTLVYQLAEPQRLQDTSWIRPGKVAWDWWNACNLYGVDFKAGVNTQTYKYFIDFASRYGLEYIILDEGWYKLGDLMSVVPEINIQELVDYGRKKNVGIILWVVWKTLDDQLAPALDQFQKWGVAGIKVDFMQRDDQWMVDYYWRVAEEAAKRKMLVDFHGAYKPCGLRRAYPNVITREGVKGLENCKWSEEITPTHTVTLPFTRMVPGPMDFTPGAMVNEHPATFQKNFLRPMSMGTRAHQAAMYVIYESPLQMLADTPSNYLRDPEFTRFIARIPTTWEDTVALDGKVGEFVVMARRSGKTWYVGAMSNEKARTVEVDLSFLPKASYRAEILQDGINVERYASDYRIVTRKISKSEPLKIDLTPGGGWIAILR